MLWVDYINAMRVIELDAIVPSLKPGARILELGAGSGAQAAELSRRGFEVEAIEIASSDYAGHRQFPVTDYDGRNIPFPDASFDIVYSSNVLEHVPHLEEMHREIRRVLKPGGEAVHILPTHSWRFWTSFMLLPGAVRAVFRTGRSPGFIANLRRAASAALRRHGERGNAFSELWLFHPRWWRRHFGENGFEMIEDRPIGLFYTAETLFGPRLPLDRRRALSETIGSTTHLYRLKPKD